MIGSECCQETPELYLREIHTDIRFTVVEAPCITNPVRLGHSSSRLGCHVQYKRRIEPFDIGNIINGGLPLAVHVIDGIEIRLDGMLGV